MIPGPQTQELGPRSFDLGSILAASLPRVLPSPASQSLEPPLSCPPAPGHQWGSSRQTLGKADCGARPLVATRESRSFPPHGPSLFPHCSNPSWAVWSAHTQQGSPSPAAYPELPSLPYSQGPCGLRSLRPVLPSSHSSNPCSVLLPTANSVAHPPPLRAGKPSREPVAGALEPHLLAPEEAAQGQTGGECLDTTRKLGHGLVLCALVASLEGTGQSRDDRVPGSTLPGTPAQCREGAGGSIPGHPRVWAGVLGSARAAQGDTVRLQVLFGSGVPKPLISQPTP